MTVPTDYPIPQQLRVDATRFIKVRSHEKTPSEKVWQDTNNYRWDDPSLVKHIQDGGNYGYLPVEGCDIVVVDIDDIGAAIALGVVKDLSETFTVRSGSGNGIHIYFRCPVSGKIPFYDKDDKKVHIGEFYGSGARAFVVGPGSVHPSGNRYAITKNIGLLEITPGDLDIILFNKVQSTRDKPAPALKTRMPEYSNLKQSNLVDQLGLRIADWATPVNPVNRGDEIQGAHPIHGSTTGFNFAINPSKNMYHCFRCDAGGDPVGWIAVMQGIMTEEDVKANGVSGDAFQQVVDYLWDHGYSDRLASNGYHHTLKTGTPVAPTRSEDVETSGEALEQYTMEAHPSINLQLEPDNFILDYINWACQKTDSYLEYHFAAALNILSVVVQRSAVLQLNQDDIYPNIWTFLLGLSSVSRKTTSIKISKRILDQTEILENEIPKSFTPESLIEILAETPQSYLIKDEASGMLVGMKKNYMSDMRYILCDLYDGEDFTRRLRTNSRTGVRTDFRVRHPYLTMLLATTPDSFEKAADVENLTSGWFYRYLWFYPNCERPFKPLAQHNVDLLTEEAALREKVGMYWTFFKCHKENSIRFQINPGMMKEFNDWSVANNNRLQKIGHDPKLAMFSRLQIHTLKLAMIFTIGKKGAMEEMDVDGMITISDAHMREAIRLVTEYFLPMAFKIYEIVELSESNNDQKRILQTMKQTHGKMQRRDLMRRVRMKSKDFDDAMRQLIHETREIREVEVKNERGSNTIFYLLNKMD